MSSLDSDGPFQTFASALTGPNRQRREKTLNSLINYVSSLEAISETEMTNLWCALFRSLYMARSGDIYEIILRITSKLFLFFENKEQSFLFYRIFWRSIRGECLRNESKNSERLIRAMMFEGIVYMHENRWEHSAVDNVMDVIEEEVLTLTPILDLDGGARRSDSFKRRREQQNEKSKHASLDNLIDIIEDDVLTQQGLALLLASSFLQVRGRPLFRFITPVVDII